jgi:DNA-directed RNA polymerase subunit K/omega
VPKRKRKVGTKRGSSETKAAAEDEVEETEEGELVPILEVEPVTREKKADIQHGFISVARVWPDHLTRYERSRIIGARALQISMGAPILVEELEKLKNPVEIAEKELEYEILPLTIRRMFPDGEVLDVNKLFYASIF